MSRTTRLLTLLQALRARTRPVTAKTLAAELGVSERTLYRDIAELIAQGAPIQGEAGLGYVLKPGLFLPPLMFSEEEIEAIILGLRYVDQRGDQVLTAAAAAVLGKIAAVLPPAAQDALSNPIALPGPAARAYPANPVDLAVFRAAIRAQRKLHIAYGDADGVRSQRVVWPIALGFLNEARVLVAWCEARDAYRTFRTDRITRANPTEERYQPRRGTLLRAWRESMGLDAVARFAPDRN